MTELLAGIEIGGTKTIVVRGRPGGIRDRDEFPTRSPHETISRAAELVARWHADAPLAAIGIASFGPVRVDPVAPDYGAILTTPKPGWSNAPLLQLMHQHVALPVAVDTDVNGAALAEQHMGAARGCDNVVYVTIGTGVGAGVLVNGQPIHGAMHPEAGHLKLRRDPADRFAGYCPFHGDCIEGLLSGPALAARFNRHPGEVGPDEPAWRPVIADLAEFFATLLLAYSPQRIVVGGGVALKQAWLLAAARSEVAPRLGNYLCDFDAAKLNATIVPALLGDNAGPNGALILAQNAAAKP